MDQGTSREACRRCCRRYECYGNEADHACASSRLAGSGLGHSQHSRRMPTMRNAAASMDHIHSTSVAIGSVIVPVSAPSASGPMNLSTSGWIASCTASRSAMTSQISFSWCRLVVAASLAPTAPAGPCGGSWLRLPRGSLPPRFGPGLVHLGHLLKRHFDRRRSRCVAGAKICRPIRRNVSWVGAAGARSRAAARRQRGEACPRSWLPP